MARRDDGAVQRIVRIEPFDPSDEATAPAYAALLGASRRCVVPEGLTLPPAYVLNRLRHTSADSRSFLWMAWDGSDAVGAAEVSWREAPDNRDRAWAHVDVPSASVPVLDALAAAAAAHCASLGRELLVAEVEHESPVAAWVASRGARFGALDEHNVLRLGTLSRADVAALAAGVPDGYELLRWEAPTPEDVLPAYASLMDTMNDAPFDDLTMEPSVFSLDRVRDWESGLALRGHALWVVAARHVASGELAAYNQLELRPEWPEVIANQDTAVTRAHRGHGLGLCVKAANLLRVLDERPDAVCVETWNSATNEHMLRVNRRLGFVREHVVAAWEVEGKVFA